MPDQSTLQLTSLILPDIDTRFGSGVGAFTMGLTGTGTLDHLTLTFDRPLTMSDGSLSTQLVLTQTAGQRLFLEAASSNGIFNVVDATLVTKDGSSISYSASELMAARISTSFTVADTRAGDVLRPTLEYISTPLNIVTTSGGAAVTFSAGARDEGNSGFATAVLQLDRTMQTDQGATDRITMSKEPDSYSYSERSGTVSVTSATASGSYNVIGATITDGAGNSRSYTQADLAAVYGARTHFTVDDKTAPTLTNLTLPTSVAFSRGTGDFSIKIAVADDAQNARNVVLTLDHAIVPYVFVPHGGHVVNPTTTLRYDLFPGSLSSDPDASYARLLDVATQAGRYVVTQALVTDHAGNSTAYTTDQLTQLGFDTVFTVEGDAVPPTLTSFALPTTPRSVGGTTPVISVGATDQGISSGIIATVNLSSSSGDTYSVRVPSSTASFQSAQETAPFVGPSGVYSVTSVVLTDYASNMTTYQADQLSAAGYRTSFQLVGAAADFDGNRYSDILWVNRDGAISTWSASGGRAIDNIRQTTYEARVEGGWHMVDTFDWNGDGKSDIVWRNDNGAVSLWTGQLPRFQLDPKPTFEQGAFNITTVGPQWTIFGAGDLNGDGRGDLVWRSDPGTVASWLSTGDGFQESAYVHDAVGLNWKIEGLGDFNGDGRADMLWRSDNGALSVWNSTGASFQETSVYHDPIDRSWDIVGIGDFNGDARDDILWRSNAGSISVWQGGVSNFVESRMLDRAESSWNVAAVGDYNGDGLADILWRQTDGAISIWHSTGTGWQQNTYYDSSVGSDWSIATHIFPV